MMNYNKFGQKFMQKSHCINHNSIYLYSTVFFPKLFATNTDFTSIIDKILYFLMYTKQIYVQ